MTHQTGQRAFPSRKSTPFSASAKQSRARPIWNCMNARQRSSILPVDGAYIPTITSFSRMPNLQQQQQSGREGGSGPGRRETAVGGSRTSQQGSTGPCLSLHATAL